MTAEDQSPDVRGSSLDTSALLSRLPGVSHFELSVVETVALTPSLRRVRLSGPGVAELQYEAGQDLMFSIPDGDGHEFRRRYTIRQLDRASGVLDVDVVVHGDGPGARWASTARAGDRIDALGPRGKVTVDADVDWHLMVADESGLPNTFALLEAVPAGNRAVVLIEVAGPDEELPVPEPGGVTVDVHWIHRGSDEPGTPGGLLASVVAMPLPEGRGHAYLAGELGVVAAIRSLLVKDRGMAAEQVSPKAYWRLGVANAAHGEPERE